MSKKKELKDKIGEYLNETWDELKNDIEALPAKERAAAKLKLLDYHLPKVQAVRESVNPTASTAVSLLRGESDKS